MTLGFQLLPPFGGYLCALALKNIFRLKFKQMLENETFL